MKRLLPLLILMGLAGPLQAQVYTYLDAEGNRVFTDQPVRGNAERVQITPSNRMPAHPAVQPAPAPSTPRAVAGYRLLRILLPQPDATLRDDDSLIVTLTSEPPLMPGHRYRLVLDGSTGDAGNSPVFALHGIERGTHQLAAEIVDAQGRILERTPAQPFHLHLVSLAQKRRTNPCQRADYGVRPECPLAERPPEPRRILGIFPR